MPQATKKDELTFLDNLIIGSLAGSLEVLVTNPLFILKSAMQQEQKNIPVFSLGFLYRGAWINALGMVPSTIIQMGVSTSLVNNFCCSHLSASFYAGVLSSVIACPVERIMLLQKKIPQYGILEASHYITRDRWSKLFVGQTATAIREGGFSVFFLSASPYFKKMLNDTPSIYTNILFSNDIASSICASIMAGSFFSVISQPIDSIKCYQQSKFHQDIGFFKAAKKLSFKELFHGLTPRTTQIILSVSVLNIVKDKIEAYINHHKTCSNKLPP